MSRRFQSCAQKWLSTFWILSYITTFHCVHTNLSLPDSIELDSTENEFHSNHVTVFDGDGNKHRVVGGHDPRIVIIDIVRVNVLDVGNIHLITFLGNHH